VDAVIEGSVRRSGDRVRITTQLVQASPERNLWAESYERGMQDILALQSEVAQAIAREIQITVTPEDEAYEAQAAKVRELLRQLPGHHPQIVRETRRLLSLEIQRSIARSAGGVPPNKTQRAGKDSQDV
jgi:hypothetical protein